MWQKKKIGSIRENSYDANDGGEVIAGMMETTNDAMRKPIVLVTPPAMETMTERRSGQYKMAK